MGLAGGWRCTAGGLVGVGGGEGLGWAAVGARVVGVWVRVVGAEGWVLLWVMRAEVLSWVLLRLSWVRLVRAEVVSWLLVRMMVRWAEVLSWMLLSLSWVWMRRAEVMT